MPDICSRDMAALSASVVLLTAKFAASGRPAKGSLPEVLMRTSLPDPRAAKKTAAFLAMTLPGNATLVPGVRD
jgi:hypothetical protein